jgi:hypothetical protein
MYVFVSWAFVDEAKKAEERLASWVKSLADDATEANAKLIEQLTAENCFPEYAALQHTTQEELLKFDSLNANLLAVRFVIPAMEKVVTYQLAKRLPGSDKLCVSLACRAFLLNTFTGQWTGDLTAPAPVNRLVFVGLQGLSGFFAELAAACAARGAPLPIDLWHEQRVVELPDATALRDLIDACAFNQPQPADQQKYSNLVLGWMGEGVSAERDSAVALASGFRLGLTKGL